MNRTQKDPRLRPATQMAGKPFDGSTSSPQAGQDKDKLLHREDAVDAFSYVCQVCLIAAG